MINSSSHLFVSLSSSLAYIIVEVCIKHVACINPGGFLLLEEKEEVVLFIAST